MNKIAIFFHKIIKVDNTDSYIADDDTEEVCQIFKEDTSFEDTTSRIRLETDLVVSQSDEAGPSTSGSNSLLQPIRIPKRRRSPVTVQEWVASLPIPHLLATDRYVHMYKVSNEKWSLSSSLANLTKFWSQRNQQFSISEYSS